MGRAARRKSLKAQTTHVVEVTYVDGSVDGNGVACLEHAMRFVDVLWRDLSPADREGVAMVQVLDWPSKVVVWSSKNG